MLRFFPTDPGVQASIMSALRDMVPSREALQKLTSLVISKCNNWPGPLEIRGLLCTFAPPADGIEADCTIPGYRPEDYEQRAIDEHAALAAGGYSEETLKLLRAAESHLLEPADPEASR